MLSNAIFFSCERRRSIYKKWLKVRRGEREIERERKRERERERENVSALVQTKATSLDAAKHLPSSLW